jgi:hypothetical protein
MPLDDALAACWRRPRRWGHRNRLHLRRRRPRAGARPGLGAAGAAAGQQLDGRLRRARADVRAAGVSCRCPSASPPATRAARWHRARGAHLHRRAHAGRRRRGGDAGRHRSPGRCARVRLNAVPHARPVDSPRRRRCHARRRGTAKRRAPDACQLGLAAGIGLASAARGAPPARGAVFHRRRTGDARRCAARAMRRAPSTTATASSCARCCAPGLRGQRSGHRARPARRHLAGAAPGRRRTMT